MGLKKNMHTHNFSRNCILWFVAMWGKQTEVRGFGGLRHLEKGKIGGWIRQIEEDETQRRQDSCFLG